jgi:hypothetical protein
VLTIIYLRHQPSQDFENLLGFSEIEISFRTAVFVFMISSPRRFVSQGNMAPSDSALGVGLARRAAHCGVQTGDQRAHQVRAEELQGLRPLGIDADLQLADDSPRFLAAQCC